MRGGDQQASSHRIGERLNRSNVGEGHQPDYDRREKGAGDGSERDVTPAPDDEYDDGCHDQQRPGRHRAERPGGGRYAPPPGEPNEDRPNVSDDGGEPGCSSSPFVRSEGVRREQEPSDEDRGDPLRQSE